MRVRVTLTLALGGVILVAAVLLALTLPGLSHGRARAGERDPDVVKLVSLGEEATNRARAVASDAILRQVNVDPDGQRQTFQFVDGAATQEITILVPSPTAPSAEWQVLLPTISKLTGHRQPGLDLSALQVGPTAASRAILTHWDGCTLRGLTLIGQDDELTWYAFCNLPDGRVAAGTIDGRTDIFQPSPAPPAYPPATAVPTAR